MYHGRIGPSLLHFAAFLSPSLYDVYEYISRYVGEQTGRSTLLKVGQSLDEFADGQAHIGFVCGLPYSHATRRDEPAIELIAAPILYPKRYQGKPIYFSDIVVRRDSPFASFDDLKECTWGYNEKTSHSGWNIVCYSLLVRGKALDYFGKLIKTGSHLRSLEMVLQGSIDAAAIDSHVLDALRVRDTALDTEFRVIDTLGPSSIPPVVVSKSLPAALKHEIEHALLSMHNHPRAVQALRRGLIEKFVSVNDDHYRPVHDMFTLVERWAADGHGEGEALTRSSSPCEGASRI